jgi:hypothetical protein
MDLIADAVAHLAARLKSKASVTITYQRVSGETQILSATPGQYLLKLTDPGGAVRMIRTDADFIVTAADLNISGVTFEPVRGDTINRTWPDGVTRKYSVLPYGPEEPLFRYCDQARALMRIHTKYAGVVA